MASREEQETTVNVPGNRALDVMIWTNVAREITAIKRKLAVHNKLGSLADGDGWVLDSGKDSDGTEWIDVRIPQEFWSSGRGIKGPKRELSAERLEALKNNFKK